MVMMNNGMLPTMLPLGFSDGTVHSMISSIAHVQAGIRGIRRWWLSLLALQGCLFLAPEARRQWKVYVFRDLVMLVILSRRLR